MSQTGISEFHGAQQHDLTEYPGITQDNQTVLHDAGIFTRKSLRKALWEQRDIITNLFSGRTQTAIAEALDWSGFDRTEVRRSDTPSVTVLEEVNGETLSVLTPFGEVVRVGDTIQYETTAKTWGSSNKRVEREQRVYSLYESMARSKRQPTYSNTSGDSDSVSLKDPDAFTVVERSDLDKYRDRYTESQCDIDIPKGVNGWSLVTAEAYDFREDDSLNLTDVTNVYDEIVWEAPTGTEIRAKWRSTYSCWYLSVPENGAVCEDNVDDTLYEIDVPQEVVRTTRILDWALKAMETLPASNYQRPYDLTTDVELPDTIGDWERNERKTHDSWVQYRNTNPNSELSEHTLKVTWSGSASLRSPRARSDLPDYTPIAEDTESIGPDQLLLQLKFTEEPYGDRTRDRFDAAFPRIQTWMKMQSGTTKIADLPKTGETIDLGTIDN
ncbi:hypothetical protein [Salinibaculum rarum]|uniref:hypothetical protein n=1 Tax=Salinibaculum rarum TaxID=3058903 RepID=UPI00265E09A2|nr:hypothetical protein [Salinibaculum sp. KK48]